MKANEVLSRLRLQILTARNDGCQVHIEEYGNRLAVKLVNDNGTIVDTGEIERRELYDWIRRREDY
jgi:hypothetical protein